MRHEIEVESGGRRLPAHLVVADETTSEAAEAASRPALLFLHGLHSSQTRYVPRADAAAQGLDAVCLTFDFSGHGDAHGDTGTITPQDHLHDAVAAYDLLASQPGVDAERLGVCAASYGAWIAAQLTGVRMVRRALLRAPALYEEAVRKRPLDASPGPSAPSDRPASLAGLAELGGDLLILESEHDEVIPHEVIEAYRAWVPGAEHRVLAGAAHSLDARGDAAFVHAILEWFAAL